MLSGFAALTYQVAWQRVLTQIIGSDAISTTLVVTIFMICLGCGAELAKRLVANSRERALRLYSIVEILVGIYGALSIPILRGVNAKLSTTSGDSLTVDFLANLVLLAAPIIGMGLTTPLIVHVAKQDLRSIGRKVGALYGWNIGGAAIGAAITGLILIEAFGLHGTTEIAAALNIIAALVAAGALSSISSEHRGQMPTTPVLQLARVPTSSALAAVLFGFGTLAVQVIYFRVLSNYLTLSPIVFPMLLCAYLCLMSIGQWVGGQLADRFAERLVHVVAALFAGGSLLFVASLHFPHPWAAAIGALRFSSFNGQLISNDYPNLIGDPSAFTALLFSSLMMISVVAWSGLFPVMFRLVTHRIEEAGNRFAATYTLYTVGNVIGTFVCGIVMLPLLGTSKSALVTVLIVGTGVLILLLSDKKSRILSNRAWLGFAIGITVVLFMPRNYYAQFALGNYSVIDVFEGRTGVATVVPTSRFYTIIDMNRTASASAINADPKPSDSYQAWRWNHSELMAFDEEFRPHNILVIGIGHAYLIDAMLDLKFVEKITVVDISSEVIAAVRKYTTTSTKRIFSDPRVKIVVGDGRRYVQSAIKDGRKYDLIQNKINEPWHAGSSNLFTEEFFAEEKRLLRPGGYLSTRPLTGHLTDGFKVFGNALWGGYYHMYFKNGNVVRVAAAVVTPDIRTAWFAELPGREAVEPAIRNTTPITIFDRVPENLRSSANTDDHPTFEYYFLRQLFGIWVSPQLQFWDLDLKRLTVELPVLYQ